MGPALTIALTAANAYFPAVKRHREPAIGQRCKRRNCAVETLHFVYARPIEPQQSLVVGSEQHMAVAGEVFRGLKLGHDGRVFEKLIWFKRAVERRNRDRCFAASENPIGNSPQAGNHRCRPQRTSYCTKSGSAFGSLYRPIRLFMIPPR